MAIDPTSSDPFEGPLAEESMAQIYAMLDHADHAIPILEKWIQVPSFTEITPSMLESAPSGIRFAMIPVFRNWLRKRNREQNAPY